MGCLSTTTCLLRDGTRKLDGTDWFFLAFLPSPALPLSAMSSDSIESSTLVLDHKAVAPADASPSLIFKELFAGTISGMAQVLSGQPVSLSCLSRRVRLGASVRSRRKSAATRLGGHRGAELQGEVD